MRATALGWGMVCLLLAAGSCSNEKPSRESVRTQAANRPVLSRWMDVEHLIDLGSLQTGGTVSRYYLDAVREPGGQLRLAFLAATDEGIPCTVTLEAATLTLVVAQRGREGWLSKTIELTRHRSSEAQRVVFGGRLPEVVREFDLTAVIPRLRIGGQRLHARFTLPATTVEEP